MGDLKQFKGFALPVRVKMDIDQMKGIYGEVFREVLNSLAINDKQLKFQLGAIDSKNVIELNTNVTNITSEDGKTVIDGPLIKMYDNQVPAQLRLEMGFNGTDFVFDMYNDSGDKTIELESDGNAVFKGSVEIGTDEKVIIQDVSNKGNISFLDATDTEIGYIDIEEVNGNFRIVSEEGKILINSLTGGSDSRVALTSNGDILILGTDSIDLFTAELTINAATGQSGIFTFGGGGTGDIASMTFEKGILTATTLVP